MGRFIFQKKYEMANFSYKKMENVNFIFKFIPSSYINKLLEIVLKIKIKQCWSKHGERPIECVTYAYHAIFNNYANLMQLNTILKELKSNILS